VEEAGEEFAVSPSGYDECAITANTWNLSWSFEDGPASTSEEVERQHVLADVRELVPKTAQGLA